MSLDWWCEITMENHKVKLIIFYLLVSKREREDRSLRAPRDFITTPKKRATTTRKTKKNQVFYIFIWPLFCFFFLWGSIQEEHVMGHASVLLLPIPPGMKKRRTWARRKTKTTRAPREWNMKRWNQLSWLVSEKKEENGRKIYIRHYSSLDWFSLSMYIHTNTQVDCDFYEQSSLFPPFS